jgi:hypothetical protein
MVGKTDTELTFCRYCGAPKAARDEELEDPRWYCFGDCPESENARRLKEGSYLIIRIPFDDQLRETVRKAGVEEITVRFRDGETRRLDRSCMRLSGEVPA